MDSVLTKIIYIDEETKEVIKENTESIETWKDQTGLEKYTIVIEGHDDLGYFPIYCVNKGYVQPVYLRSTEPRLEFTGICELNKGLPHFWFVYCSKDNYNHENTVAKTDTGYSKARLVFGENHYEQYTYIDDSIEGIEFFNISISTGSMSDSYFTYGSCYSPSCTVTMSTCPWAKPGVWFRVEFEIGGNWQEFGVFKIQKPASISMDSVTFDGYGVIDSVFSDEGTENNIPNAYLTLNNFMSKVYEAYKVPIILPWYDELDQQTKNAVDDYMDGAYIANPYTYEEVDQNLDIEQGGFVSSYPYYETPTQRGSIREQLSKLAISLHCNVVERCGAIYIEQALPPTTLDSSKVNFTEDDISEPSNDSEYLYVPSPIYVSTKQQEYRDPQGELDPCVYMDKDNQTVKIFDYKDLQNWESSLEENYIMYPVTIDAESLWCQVTEISSAYWGSFALFSFRNMVEIAGLNKSFFNYKPIDVEVIGYHPCIYAGSSVYFTINGKTTERYIGNVTINWDGGISMNISTPGDVDISGVTSSTTGTSSSAGAGSLTLKIPAGTMGNIIDGKIFKDGAITGSKIQDSTITGSKFVDGTITGSKIKESTITGSLISDNTISGNKISENTITGNLIQNNTLTGNLIKDGTITNNLIQDSTLTGAKIHDATIGLEKVDESFITNLTADDAYIKDLTAKVANISTLKVDDAIIKNIQAVAINADYIKAITADIGYLTTNEADIKYASITLGNIDTANIDKANIGLLFNEVGLIDRATIVDGHITGFLDAVEVNANKITAGTLIAERLLLKGSEDGLLFALNNMGELTSQNVDTLDGGILTERTVTADKLIANSITANEIDVENIFSDSAVLTTLISQSAFINAISTNSVVVGAKNTASTALNTANEAKKQIYHTVASGSGQGGYWIVAQLKVLQTYANQPISLTVLNRNGIPSTVWIAFANANNTDPEIRRFAKTGDVEFYLVKSAIGTWDLYIQKSESYDSLSVTNFEIAKSSQEKINFSWKSDFISYSDFPSVHKKATQTIATAEWCYDNDITQINGGKIATGTIKANSIDVTDLFAQKIEAKNFSMNCDGEYKSGIYTYKTRLEMSPNAKTTNERIIELYGDKKDETGGGAYGNFFYVNKDGGIFSASESIIDGVVLQNHAISGINRYLDLGGTKGVSIEGDIYSGVKPSLNNEYDIGTSSKAWKDIYGTTIHGDKFLSETENGSDISFIQRRTDTGVKVGMGIGSGGINHGIYSYELSKWLVYGDKNNVYLNGKANMATNDENGNNIATQFSNVINTVLATPKQTGIANNRMRSFLVKGSSSSAKGFGGVIEFSTTSAITGYEWREFFMIPTAYRPSITIQATAHVFVKNTSQYSMTYAVEIYRNGNVAINGPFNANGLYRILIPTVWFV